MARPPTTKSHVVAGVVCGAHEVDPVDRVDIRVVFAVKLLSVATVHPYSPQLKHLPHCHIHIVITTKTQVEYIILSRNV